MFKAFVKDTALFWEDAFGYTMTRGRSAGQLAHIYPIFRDEVLLQALRERGVGAVAPRYDYKRAKRMNGQLAPRAVVGWAMAA